MFTRFETSPTVGASDGQDRQHSVMEREIESMEMSGKISFYFFFLSSFLSEGEGGDRVSPNHLWYCQRPKNGGMFLVAFSSSFTPEMDKNPLVDVLSTCLVEE